MKKSNIRIDEYKLGHARVYVGDSYFGLRGQTLAVLKMVMESKDGITTQDVQGKLNTTALNARYLLNELRVRGLLHSVPVHYKLGPA